MIVMAVYPPDNHAVVCHKCGRMHPTRRSFAVLDAKPFTYVCDWCAGLNVMRMKNDPPDTKYQVNL